MKVRRISSKLSGRLRKKHIYLRTALLDSGSLEAGWSYEIRKSWFTDGLIHYSTLVEYRKGAKSVGCLLFFETLELSRSNIREVQDQVKYRYAHFVRSN
jgi:hypothetical protein